MIKALCIAVAVLSFTVIAALVTSYWLMGLMLDLTL